MASHPHLPNKSTPLQMDGQPDVPTSESVTKEMADYPHKPTSTSASQETKGHPPTSTSEPVTKEMASHTDKPNKSAPQEINDQPDMPTSESATKEIAGHSHKPTSTSASQEPESHPPTAIIELVTKEIASHTDNPNESAPQETGGHPRMPNESTPQEMDGQPDVPSSESVTKEMAGHFHKPTSTSASQEPESTSASQESESHPPTAIIEPVSKEIASHTDKPNESAPQEIDGHPRMPNESTPQEMDGYPDAPTSDSVTKEVEGHCKKATFDRSKDLDIQSGTPFSQKSSKCRGHDEMHFTLPKRTRIQSNIEIHDEEIREKDIGGLYEMSCIPEETKCYSVMQSSLEFENNTVIGNIVNEYHTGQAMDVDISMDGVWNSTADMSSESGFHPKLSRDIGFSRSSILSRNWTNNQIKELRPKDLNCTNFADYLDEHIPCPSLRINNDERRRIYQESSTCSNKDFNNIFRAFLCYAFPPIDIPKTLANEFKDVTYEYDQFPQFTCICSSSMRNKTRVSISCEICPIYEKSCFRRGKFFKLGRSTV